MFEFLLKNKTGEIVNLLDIIGSDLEKIQLAALAEEKAIGMIAKAIAKSEIVLTNRQGRIRDERYYRLNIQPNANQSGTDFWYFVARRLLSTGECLVAEVGGRFYVIKNCQASERVTGPKTYSDITITDGKDELAIRKKLSAEDVLVLRYENDKIRAFRQNVLERCNSVLQAVTSMAAISNTPLFKYKLKANASFRTVDKSGKEIKLTLDEVVDRLKNQISGKDLAIIRETEGTELVTLDIPTKTGASDVKAMAEQINAECAAAYDIPAAVFSGTITEKSDATNEFITFAVQPVAEVISDQLNAKLVGEEGYIAGERAFVWLARFKHVDVIDAAANLDKLRGIGFTLDEIFSIVGYPEIGTEFATTRALTKNYATEAEVGPEDN